MAGYVDPFSILVRGLALAVYPAFNHGVTELVHLHLPGGPRLRQRGDRTGLHSPQDNDPALSARSITTLAILSGAILLAVFLLELVQRRFFCRNLCPLGGLLGLTARAGFVQGARRQRRLQEMPPAEPSAAWAPSGRTGASAMERCILCMDCRDKCPRNIISFRYAATGQSRPPRSRCPAAPLSTSLAGGRRPAAVHRRAQPGQGAGPFADPPARRPAGGGVPRPLRPLRRMHEGLHRQRPAPDLPAGRARRDVLPRPGCPDRLLRVQLHPLRPGLPHRRHPRAAAAGKADLQDRPRLFRHEPLPALRQGHTMHRLRGALPDPGQGDQVRNWPTWSTTGARPCRSSSPTWSTSLCIGCGICENKCPLPDRAAVYVTTAGEARNPEQRPAVLGPRFIFSPLKKNRAPFAFPTSFPYNPLIKQFAGKPCRDRFHDRERKRAKSGQLKYFALFSTQNDMFNGRNQARRD